MISRRELLKLAPPAIVVSPALAANGNQACDDAMQRLELREARLEPVLRRDLVREPVIVDRVELLRRDGEYFVKATCAEGVSGWAMANPGRMPSAFGILPTRVAPYFAGKDARDLDRLIDGVFVHGSNYKWQGLPFWSCVARTEFALLDLLGKRSGQPVHALIGGKKRNSVGVYYANGDREHSAAWVVDRLRESLAESGARAVKFKLGARMHFTEASMARDLELVPLVREALGPDIVLYADANSSYDVATAIRIGRLMEEYGYGFFEEPVQFDYLEETRQVADAIDIPVAGGEQESSLWRFEWMIGNRAVDIVQPDLHYFGGYIRATRVARMAEAAGMPCTVHMSGGLGYLNVLHFVSYIPNPGPYQEFKGESGLPLTCETSTLECKDGSVRCPSGPGFGVTIDPEFVRKAERVTAL